MIELVPAEAALLVIDPQNAFCHPDGTSGRDTLVPAGAVVAPAADEEHAPGSVQRVAAAFPAMKIWLEGR